MGSFGLELKATVAAGSRKGIDGRERHVPARRSDLARTAAW